MACIRGGSFIRGSEAPRTCAQGEVRRIPKNEPNHRPVQTIFLPTYYLDLTEVTFADYQRCVTGNKCSPARPAYNDFSAPNQPMVGVTWFQAQAYCRAMGKHLPTEAQWEKAARGSQGELYPWGNEKPSCEKAVIRDTRGRGCGVQKAPPSPTKGKTSPVMSKPPGRYGIYDLIGNAEEWTADWYSSNWSNCGEDCAGFNPRGPCGDGDPAQPCPGRDRKVVRGGSWYWPASCATAWTRRPHYPENKPYHHFGFRCAATLNDARQIAEKASK